MKNHSLNTFTLHTSRFQQIVEHFPGFTWARKKERDGAVVWASVPYHNPVLMDRN